MTTTVSAAITMTFKTEGDTKMKTQQTPINWIQILESAVNEPGKLLEAYQNFHNYSFGNVCAILTQCKMRGLPLGPVATYKHWQELGRQVKKNQKAIWLCQPMVINPKDEEEQGGPKVFFKWRPSWFLLSQTEGKEIDQAVNHPEWNQQKALPALGIELVEFKHHNGNAQGYATPTKQVAINPLAQLPHKTMFHELAHIVLGHTDIEAHASQLPNNIQEVEAESVALLCLASLNLPGAEYCRGYIQNWLRGGKIPEKSAQAIFKAADTILKAGTEGKQSQPIAKNSPAPSPAYGPKARAAHGVDGDGRETLANTLLEAWREAPEALNPNNPALTLTYGGTTYTLRNERKAIEQFIRRLGWGRKLDAYKQAIGLVA